MATFKTPLTRNSSLPSFKPIRTIPSLKSPLSPLEPVLPNIISTTILQKHRSKKRVRFALTLEEIEEDPSIPDHENSPVPTTKPRKRIIDPWREDGPLYGTYVEYLAKQDILSSDIPDTNQPSTAPEPEVESSTYTHTFVFRSKSPELVIDSITVSTPSIHLPRLLQRTTANKKKNNVERPSTPTPESSLKRQLNISNPPRYVQSKKIYNSANHRSQATSAYPFVRRTDFALPSLKTVNYDEKLNQTDTPLATKIANEYLQSKKFTEIIMNPLPGTNNQINHLSQPSIVYDLPKTPQISCDAGTNNDPYFYQNHTNDHIQPIIHSTH